MVWYVSIIKLLYYFPFPSYEGWTCRRISNERKKKFRIIYLTLEPIKLSPTKRDLLGLQVGDRMGRVRIEGKCINFALTLCIKLFIFIQ